MFYCEEFPPVLPFVSLSLQFEIRQLRAHLAQQDLDLVAEREAAMQIHHMWGKQSNSFQEVDGLAPGASEHHGPAKAREPGGAAGNRLEHLTSLLQAFKNLCAQERLETVGSCWE